MRKNPPPMHILVKYPCIVEQDAPHFEHLFSPEGYRYFRRFLSGLLVSENKTLEAINRLFVLERRNQSSFNRFVNRQPFDMVALNRARVGLMQQTGATRFKSSSVDSGVLALDDSLMRHYGKHFENIYHLYDHVRENYTFAHNLVSVHYSDDKTDYPVSHQLWLPPDWEAVAIKMRQLGLHVNGGKWDKRFEAPRKWRQYMRERFKDCQFRAPALQEVYKTKLFMGLDMLRQFRRDYPDLDLPVAMDGGYTGADLCRILDEELQMAYVGSLADYQKVELEGSEQITLADFKERLLKQHREGKTRFFKTTVPYKGEKEIYHAYCATHRINGFSKRQRLVIAFKQQDLNDTPCFSISNRHHWFASGILRVRRHRWPVETFHQEGKDEGLDKYQLRNFEGIETHVAFVSTAYTMLKRAAHDDELLSRFRLRLGIAEPLDTLPLLRRLSQLEGMMALVEFVHLKASHGQPVQAILKQLLHTVAY